jgi:hypothetical protein
MFWAAVVVLVLAGVILITTPLWWVPAAGGLCLGVFCLNQGGVI